MITIYPKPLKKSKQENVSIGTISLVSKSRSADKDISETHAVELDLLPKRADWEVFSDVSYLHY